MCVMLMGVSVAFCCVSRRCTEVDPKSSFVRSNYGLLLLQEQRYDEAITQLKEAIKIAADTPRVQ